MRSYRPFLIHGLALASYGLLAAALILPIARAEAMIFFSNDVSILGVLDYLRKQGEWLLFGLILVFSIAFPAAKVALVQIAEILAQRGRPSPRMLRIVERTAKWSMTDVFILAFAIVAAKGQLVVTLKSSVALYFFLGFIASSTAALMLARRSN